MIQHPATVLRIQTANSADAPLIASIIRQSFQRQAEILGLSPDDCPGYVAFETDERALKRIASGAHVAIAYLGDDPIGTVSVVVPSAGAVSGEIVRLAVLPAFRGNAYGNQLMQYAEARLAEAGAHVAEVGIVAQFARLAAYYEGLGYRPKDTRRFPALPFDVLFMEKQLVG